MKNKQVAVSLFVIVIAVLMAYYKVFHAGFMSWDDLDYVFNTADIHGFSAAHFKNWWTSFYIGNYQPLPVMSYAFDYEMSGTNPVSYHLQNILWHIATSVMLYFLLLKLFGKNQIAIWVVLLFALHPVQTESVSWIAARNKVMNGFFFFWSMYLYTRYIANGKKSFLTGVYMAGVLAYLCKSTAIMLPFSLIAIDIWLKRPLNNKRIWLEKLPLLLLALPIGIITLQAQKEVAFLNLHPETGLLQTIIYAGYAYCQYLLHLVFPIHLSVLYPYPKELGWVHVVCTLLSAGIISFGMYAWKKGWRMAAGGILFFTVNIIIVLQFIQFGEVLMADRYLYVASVGLWLPVVYYLSELSLFRLKPIVLNIVLASLCACYGLACFVRNDIWLNEINFWKSVTENYPESAVAQYSLGAAYLKEGNINEAAQGINQSIVLDPSNYKAWYNKGVLEMRKNNAPEALDALNRALSIHDYPKALFTRALLYQQTGSPEMALNDIDKFLQTEPSNAKALYIKADCLEQQQQLGEAMVFYNKAIEADAQSALFWLRRGLAYAKMQQLNKALQDIDQAVQLDENNGENWYWRGLIKYKSGQSPCADLHEALNRNYLAANAALASLCK